MTRQPDVPALDLYLLTAFFAAGAVAATVTAVLIAWPGTRLDVIWRLNPDAQRAFGSLGKSAMALMLPVAGACATAAIGIHRRRRWGYITACGLLVINLVGDLGNAIVRGDSRALIGLPIGGAMLWYLSTPRVRNAFQVASR